MSRRSSLRWLTVGLAVAAASSACTLPDQPDPGPTVPPRTGTVVRLATGGAITEAVISRNGRYVAYTSTASTPGADANGGATDVFVIDRQSSATQRVSAGNGASDSPSVADDGSVVYRSASSNISGPDLNGHVDAFRWTSAGMTTRLTDSPGDVTAPLVSADGTAVTFGAPIGLTTPGGGTMTIPHRWLVADASTVALAAGGPDGAVPVSISADGARVLLAEPGRLSLWEASTGTALLVAVPGPPASAPKVTTFSVSPHALADDGDVVYGTLSYNFDAASGSIVFLTGTVQRWDRQATTSSPVAASGLAADPVQSADGRHVLTADLKDVTLDQDTPPAFLSGAIRSLDRTSGASVSAATAPSSSFGTVSADGRYVAFVSTDPSLVLPDANGAGADVYLWDRGA